MAADAVEQKVSGIVCRLAKIPSLTAEQDVFDAGLASVQALELLIELETAFNVSLSDDDFVTRRTVRDFSVLIIDQGGVA